MSEYTLHLGDCLEVMKTLPDNSVDAVITDPPYYRVKADAWDRQWNTPAGFLAWMAQLCEEWHRILKPNGSLYVFASPEMAARVEVEVLSKFAVLNHIVWSKNDEPTHALKYGDDRFRQFVKKSERIIFAEHYNADNIAKGEAGYQKKCDELRGFLYEPIRAYLLAERDRAGVSTQQLDTVWQIERNSKGQMAGHWFGTSQWALPTEANYQWLRSTLSSLNHGGAYLQRPYEELRTEYEELRTEYEELRRPFNVSAEVPFTDVWTFPTVQNYRGKHPCEKPASMIEHIVRASTREGQTVLDCFLGSGVTGEVCEKLNRNFIGIEKDAGYFEIAKKRIESVKQQEPLFAQAA